MLENVNKKFKIFDTHAHYNDSAYDLDRENLLKTMFANGVDSIVLVGANLEDSKSEKELAVKYNNILDMPKLYFTVGVHPDDIIKVSPDSDKGIWYLDELRKLAKRSIDFNANDKNFKRSHDAIAIGEIGLDYYGDFKTDDDYKLQKEWFIAQLNLARELNLPIVVHSRESCKDTFDIIKEQAKGMSGIIHCFSYEKEIALEYVKLGFHIGIGGILTFKNARKVKEVVEAIPLEYIVTETDCPYLAPMPYRGKRNESSYISYVIDEIVKIKASDNRSLEEIYTILYNNALKVYNL